MRRENIDIGNVIQVNSHNATVCDNYYYIFGEKWIQRNDGPAGSMVYVCHYFSISKSNAYPSRINLNYLKDKGAFPKIGIQIVEPKIMIRSLFTVKFNTIIDNQR
jgi:hypothetical protein